MRHVTRLIGAIAVVALALSGCGNSDPEATADTANNVSEQDPASAEKPEVFRESIGLFRATDPATVALAELLDADQAALDLTLFIEDEVVETTEPVDGAAGSVNLWFFFDTSEQNFLTLNVPQEALTIGDIEKQDSLSTLRGLFSVEASSGSDVDYVLTLIGDVPETETMDEQRCGEEQAFIADAAALADDPSVYATVREHWMDSPRMWWAVKATARSLAVYGNASDSMAIACAIYW